ncbi:MAG: hypothetical protein C0469_17335 [Cyanobacteria bacterium DS2.3.42]|nr:hypothetical protein [Cyanobacteria bacterium DS2.3.42]
MITATKDRPTRHSKLARFGFSFEKGGAHTARTMMLEELDTLLLTVSSTDVTRADYVRAIAQDNCLKKRSGKTRSLTARHLVDLYSLDPATTVFRVLLYFWKRDPSAKPLLSLLCAYARDPILRVSAPYILHFSEGNKLKRQDLEDIYEEQFPERFSKSTLKSIAQNVGSTWTKSGHLSGRAQKIRHKVEPTIGAVSYALFLGYLAGTRGEALFSTEYAKLLDCTSNGAMMELASQASQRGWLVFKRVSNVVDVSFPNLLTAEELGWIREQD